mgnify:CR=1 FL=1
MKTLRGGAFDVFGKTAERKMERTLITEYRDLLQGLTKGLTKDNHTQAARIAGLVMDIRGFGPVKEQAVQEVRTQIATDMAQF